MNPEEGFYGIALREDRPRVDALFAPGAQSATAWLQDGTFWNGDIELAFTDSNGQTLTLQPQKWRPTLHAFVPTGGRGELDVVNRPASVAVDGFIPWQGSDSDTMGWTRLFVRAFPPKQGPRVAKGTSLFQLAVRSAGPTGRPLHPRAPISDIFRYTVSGDRVLRNGRTILIVRPAQLRMDSPVSGGGWLDARLSDSEVPANERVVVLEGVAGEVGFTRHGWVWDIWLAPVGGAARNAQPPDTDLDFYESFQRTAEAWRVELEHGAGIVFPDSTLQASFVAAQRLVIGNRERRNGRLHFLGNPFQYRDLYLRDGARTVHALGLLGRSDLAKKALDGLFRFQWPSGAFLSQRGQLDGTGQALWALASYAAHGGDSTHVTRLLGPAVRGARWIAIQRGSSSLRGGIAAGLLPYADPRDNELTRGHLFGNDAWALAGLESLAPLLRRHGRAATADTVEQEAREYRAILIETWEREAQRQRRPLPPVVEGGGHDWGNLSAAYPCGVFAPNDARFLALDRWLRTDRSNEGLLFYGSRDSLHHYLGFDLTQAALRRGDRATFLADLDALLAHEQSDGTGFELVTVDGGFGDNLPPHGTYAAMFVDLARSAIAFERGDSLVLLAGLPRFLPHHGPVRLHGAPTRLGRIELDLEPIERGLAWRLQADLPAPAVVEWPSAELRAVRSGDRTLPIEGRRRFRLPAGRIDARVELDRVEGR